MWEGQLCLAVKDGDLWFLFKNKGNLYNDRSFEMLVALTQHCCHNSVANASMSLLLLFNNVQGNDESILQYWLTGFLWSFLSAKWQSHKSCW